MTIDMKQDPRPKLALVLDTLFALLNYIIPALFFSICLKLGWASYIAEQTKQRYGGNVFSQAVATLNFFLVMYFAILLMISLTKALLSLIAGLKQNLLGKLMLYLAMIFALFPFLWKLGRVTPLRDQNKKLYKRLISWAKTHQLALADILVLQVRRYTRAANAFSVGKRKHMKVLLMDTLFDVFTPSEIEAIVAHEFGHAYDVLSISGIGLIRLGCAVLITGLSFWSILVLDAVRLIPALALLILGYWFITMVLTNTISKYQEILADTFGALRISDIATYKNALIKLVIQNFDTLSYPRLIEFLFTHPATEKRLANLEALQSAFSVKE